MANFHFFELPQTATLAPDLMQRSLRKVWKGYYLNGARIPSTEPEEDAEILQRAETNDKVPILNTFEILAQTPFVQKDDDNGKINKLLVFSAAYYITNCYYQIVT